MTALALALEAEQVLAACQKVAALPVTTQAQLDDLAGGLIEAAARLKHLEETRLSETKPDRDRTAARNALSKPAEDAYKALKVSISARITRYNQETRAAENVARLAALATQEQAHAAASAGNLTQAASLQTRAFSALAAAPPVLETEGTHTRREWRVRVTNKALVAPMWTVVDEAALVAHARKVLPKAAPGADASAFRVAGVEVYLYEHEVVTGR